MNISNFSLTPSAKVEEQAQNADLNQLIATFRRHDRLFYSVAAIIFVGVVLLTFMLTPRYTGTADVMIDMRTHEVSNVANVLSGLPDDTNQVDTEVEVIQSRGLAERVDSILKLDDDPEFNKALLPVNPVIAVLKAPFDAIRAVFPAKPETTAMDPETLKKTKIHEAVIDKILKRLTVRRSGLTYVIEIGFESQDPVKAANIANTFADRYLLEQLEAKFEATRQANQWLTERLSELEPQVQQAEAAVESYKASHGLLAAENSTLTEQEISQLNGEVSQAQADAASADAALHTAQEQLAQGSTGEDVGAALNSQVIQDLRKQRADISREAAELETKYGPRHPDVLRVNRQLADVDAQIKQEVGRLISNLQAQSYAAHQRAASLNSSLSQSRGTLASNNQASVELEDLQRKADAASALYNDFLTRAKQTSGDQSDQTSDARVVSRAKIPIKPSFPNKILAAALGMLLGLGAGVAAVFLMEALDSGLATSEDVERILGVPHLGAVPLLDSTTDGKASGIPPHRYLLEKPLSAFSESFRNLRASILFSKVDTPVKVVVVTSALPGEGKTTTTVCLGRSIATSGTSVVVVDCDLRRRNINRLLGVEPEIGLIDVLQGTAKLDDVLIHDEPSGAYFLPLAKSAYTPKDLFGSGAMDRLLQELKQRFDLVLLDTAPVIPVSDTRILAPKGDIVVFLVRWRKVPRKAVQAAFAMLSSVGADIAGVALTLVDAREQAKYGYGDAGYYYRSYRKYYAQ